MKNTNVYLKVLLLVATTALLSSCGSNTEPNDYDFSSRVNHANDPISAVDPKTRPLAYCNLATNSLIEVATSAYKSGDTVRNDFINLKFTKIPAYFSASKNYVQFWKWQANPQGQTDMGSKPLRFQLVEIATEKPLTNAKTLLYWDDLQSATQAVGVNSAADLFRKVKLVIDLEDPFAEYDVIRTVYYNLDNSKVTELDSLLPIFDADPTRYAIEPTGATRAQVLQSLHPFKSAVGLGWTTLFFQTKANEFCSPFSTY